MYSTVRLTNTSNSFRFKGTYCSQEVAIKILKAEHVSSDWQKEFAQEVYIMRLVVLGFLLVNHLRSF